MAAPQGWSKLYNDLPWHPKFIAAGHIAGWLYIAGQAYCSRHLTDGKIPKGVIPRLTGIKRVRKACLKLIEVGLWHEEKDHYLQHDYCDMQRTASDVATIRSANKQRQRKSRLSRRDIAVTHSDVTVAESESEESTDVLPTSEPVGSDPGGWKAKIKKLPSECEQIIRKRWLPHAEIPTSTKASAKAQFRMLDTLRLLNSTDQQPWDRIGAIVEHAATVWKPRGYIGSPASLRESTDAADQKKWEAILAQINAEQHTATDDALDELIGKL